jgi:putative endonuclease
MKQPMFYIMASKKNGTLYTGVTSNLIKRVYEHKNNLIDGFTKRYGCKLLIFYEAYVDMYSAIEREK